MVVEDYSKENCKIEEIVDLNKDGTAVYFDPELGTKCDTYTETNSATGVKTGCMKWYTFGGNNDSETVNLLLDHNTIATVAWNTNNDNTDSSEIDAKVSSDTSGWAQGLNPRLITAGEIAEITNHLNAQKYKDGTAVTGDWFYFQNHTQSNPSLSQGQATYKWLFGRTYNCTSNGCDIADNSTYGYWTSTAVLGSSSFVWRVDCVGTMNSIDVSNSSRHGIRPVITVSKSILK